MKKRSFTACDCGDHAFGTLTRGYVCLVSKDDVGLVDSWNWTALVSPIGRVSAVRRENDGSKFFYMHRQILSPENGVVVDHINGDATDNRRPNLRLCTQGQNTKNRRSPKKGMKTSEFKGVWTEPNRKGWCASLRVNYKTIHLGTFENEADAARAYDDAAVKHFGEYALTNARLGLAPQPL